ncbi:hypothetical protein [Salinicola sp. CPA57]|uniref:hypothetical protein n=1 Tax=Salinicola sp. CPA57 TaxID=1949080 RepID=UPI001E460738|nr:hypothetical protein [Salinicola sp. CPA57]
MASAPNSRSATLTTQDFQSQHASRSDSDEDSREFARERVPTTRQLSGKYFLGAYAGEHVAGTEFVIGASLVALGVNAGDLLWGLLLGNLLAVLSWAWVCSPVATRSRMTLYWYLERLAGKRLSRCYNLINGIIFAVTAGAMMTVSASAFRVVTNIEPQTTWYPQSMSFVALVLFVGAITVWMTLKGFKLIANFSTVCSPWMAIMFLVSGIISIATLMQIGALDGVTSLSGVIDTFVWTGSTPEGDPGISMWVVAAWAWGCNLPMHLGMSDMSILRFARKSTYGYFSAAGMFIGHYMAWVCAGLMGATAALLAQTQVVDLDSGEVAFRILGYMGLAAVVIAGWTTSIPSLYRAGLALQSVFPRYSWSRVTLITGILTALVACFPFVFTQWLNVLSYFSILIAPIGAIIAAEHFLLPRLGMRPFWREQVGQRNNLPALGAWVIGIGIAVLLGGSGLLHLFTLFLPTWFAALLAYPALCRFYGVAREKNIDFYSSAYGAPMDQASPVNSAPRKHLRNPWYLLALGCLVAILVAAGWAWSTRDTTAHLDTFHSLIVLPTLIYFVAALLWMRTRRGRSA